MEKVVNNHHEKIVGLFKELTIPGMNEHLWEIKLLAEDYYIKGYISQELLEDVLVRMGKYRYEFESNLHCSSSIFPWKG